MGHLNLEILLAISKAVSDLVHSYQVLITAQYFPGRQNVWTNAESQFAKASVDGNFCPKVFLLLTTQFSFPGLDIFASSVASAP